MPIFFDTSSPANEALMARFDEAFETFRQASLGYLATAPGLGSRDVSYSREIKSEIEVLKRVGKPSEANEDPIEFLTFVELAEKENELRAKAFAKADNLDKGKAGDDAGLEGIFNSMQASYRQTIGRPEFAAINQSLQVAVMQPPTLVLVVV
jgi:hypothetical protein